MKRVSECKQIYIYTRVSAGLTRALQVFNALPRTECPRLLFYSDRTPFPLSLRSFMSAAVHRGPVLTRRRMLADKSMVQLRIAAGLWSSRLYVPYQRCAKSVFSVCVYTRAGLTRHYSCTYIRVWHCIAALCISWQRDVNAHPHMLQCDSSASWLTWACDAVYHITAVISHNF